VPANSQATEDQLLALSEARCELLRSGADQVPPFSYAFVVSGLRQETKEDHWRLIRVDEHNGGIPRRLKESPYDRQNVGSDKRAGKLVQTTRHSWVDIVGPLGTNPGFLDVRLSESFVYAGRGGRMSERQTRYQLGTGHFAFQSGFGYDLQGNLATLDYPECLHANDSCAQVSPPRQVSFTYD